MLFGLAGPPGRKLYQLKTTKGGGWPGPEFNDSVSLKGRACVSNFITAFGKNVWPVKEIAA